MVELIIAITIVGSLIWGLVIIRLAAMGLKHPEHQSFLIQLARSKKIDMPNIIFEKLRQDKEENRND